LPGFGMTVLRNRHVTIGDAGGSFDLIGVDDWGSRWFAGGYDLEQATAGRDPDRASVLLAHQPNGIEGAAEKRIGLQLSGHTHGGQMFPGNLVGELIWGPRNAGLSKLGNTQLYTSRGCGFVGPPVRVGAPPEVVKVVLVAA
jgi:predicted MPP superfamily phosphohydrolase